MSGPWIPQASHRNLATAHPVGTATSRRQWTPCRWVWAAPGLSPPTTARSCQRQTAYIGSATQGGRTRTTRFNKLSPGGHVWLLATFLSCFQAKMDFTFSEEYLKKSLWKCKSIHNVGDVSGGPVVETLSSSAGDTGSPRLGNKEPTCCGPTKTWHSQVNKKIKIKKSTMWHRFTLTRMVITKGQTKQALEDVGKAERSHLADGNGNWCSRCGKLSFKMWNVELSHGPESPLVRI